MQWNENANKIRFWHYSMFRMECPFGSIKNVLNMMANAGNQPIKIYAIQCNVRLICTMRSDEG